MATLKTVNLSIYIYTGTSDKEYTKYRFKIYFDKSQL